MNQRRKQGFSLIEVMVVVVIIGLLAGAVALKAGGFMDSAKQNRARSDIAAIVKAVEAYRLTHHHYPGIEQGLDGLAITSRTDPWGQRYQYNRPGPDDQPFEVFTLGEDQREGGEGPDADIFSWQLGDGPAGG
jgi:general secretion pathway protein G